MECLSGRIHAIDSDPVLESSRARQMWLEIVCDGQVSPIKVKCNSVHGRGRCHAKVKCTSVHGKGRRHVEKINQTCKAKCINSAMQKCSGSDKALAILDRFVFVFARSVQNDSCMLIRRLKHNLPMTSSRGDAPIVAHLFTTTLLLGV